jgi:hypothetical protein
MMEKDMNTHDKNGNPWAKLSELKAGDTVQLDDGFTCVKAGYVTLEAVDGMLCFHCAEGTHAICGQANDGEHCVGVYGPITTD